MPIKSTSPELQHSKKSLDSTVPIDSNREAISVRISTESPELHRQVHATSDQIQADSTTGDYFPHDGVHPTEISVQMDGGIVGGENSGEKRTQIAGVHESSGNVATAKDKPTEDNGQVQRQRKDQPGPLKQSTGKEL
ncbi:hypothetical protein KY284_035987 [Solanum tuberosum]|nr:hypothetical protein KY284_035987 [Solanum tuberosum]